MVAFNGLSLLLCGLAILLTVDKSTIVVKVGDIFEENGLKVVGFNEYFDTIVSEKIISENSLNGIYLKRFVQNISKLDRLIEEDEELQEKVVKFMTLVPLVNH
ncbi:MAG: macro domain-containing protein [Candidatus Pristimantibacillus sp.]